MTKVISIAIGIATLIGGLFTLDARYEHKLMAKEAYERIEQTAISGTQRQILEMRLELYRLKLEHLRKVKQPTEDDKDEIEYLRAQIKAIRAQLESLDRK